MCALWVWDDMEHEFLDLYGKSLDETFGGSHPLGVASETIEVAPNESVVFRTKTAGDNSEPPAPKPRPLCPCIGFSGAPQKRRALDVGEAVVAERDRYDGLDDTDVAKKDRVRLRTLDKIVVRDDGDRPDRKRVSKSEILERDEDREYLVERGRTRFPLFLPVEEIVAHEPTLCPITKTSTSEARLWGLAYVPKRRKATQAELEEAGVWSDAILAMPVTLPWQLRRKRMRVWSDDAKFRAALEIARLQAGIEYPDKIITPDKIVKTAWRLALKFSCVPEKMPDIPASSSGFSSTMWGEAQLRPGIRRRPGTDLRRRFASRGRWRSRSTFLSLWHRLANYPC
jgi:hypothetical protein